MNDPMVRAKLINRGEQFVVIESAARYEGECVWSWEERSGEMPRPVYPIRIFVRSIQRCETSGAVRLSAAEQRRIAALAKRSLEDNEPGFEALLLEDD